MEIGAGNLQVGAQYRSGGALQMGKRSGVADTGDDVAALTLSDLNDEIARMRQGYVNSGTSQGRKSFFKRLVWLEAHRERLHGVIAPERRFNAV